MKKAILYTILPLWLLLFSAGCSEDTDSGIPAGKAGEEVRVALNLNLMPETPGDALTRSITAADGVDEGTMIGSQINNVWVFQYDENDVQVGQPRYLDFEAGDSRTSLPVLHSGGAQHTLIFLANTHDSNLGIELGNIVQLSDFLARYHKIERETDCYVKAYSGNYLMFNGYYKGPVGGAISVDLYRNVTKLSLKLQNDAASGLTIDSVQVFNVPEGVYYADQREEPVNGRFPVPTTISYIDYPKEEFVVNSDEGPATITWYVPRNTQGAVTNSDSKKKNTYAPYYATFIKVFAKNANDAPTVFTICPGANLTNDFNLKGNHHYTVSVKIDSKGDFLTDSRIQDFDRKDFASANSFILNPSPLGTQERVFTIPVDKVNEFWSLETYGDPANVLDDDTEWVATLIWQDVNDSKFIRFIDEDTGVELLRQNGKGTSQRIFVTTDGRNMGNALIGLRKADTNGDPVGEEYLWSWHLWVTDYNPDYAVHFTPVDGQYIYRIPFTTADAVHRYAGADWETGDYKDKFIMDRNLGTRNSTNNGSVKEGQIYYQFGQKNPYPSAIPLYDIIGDRIYFGNMGNADPIRKVNSQLFLMTTVNLNPTTYYYNAPTVFSTKTPWNSFNSSKSIFDPCPPGWNVPANTAYADFTYIANDPEGSTVLNSNRPEIGTWNVGTSYWPLNTTNETGLKIYYPANGRRASTTGDVSLGSYLYLWFSTPANIYQAYWIYLQQNNFYKGNYQNANYGAPVRCIQE